MSHPSAASLNEVALFHGLTPEQRARIAQLSEEVSAEVGALIVDQGDTGTACFVLLAGQVDVYVANEFITSLGPNSLIGEMALIDRRPRNASVLAATPCTLLRIDVEHFHTLLAEMPEAREVVLGILHVRAKRSNG